jgi:acyl-CoA synthetase (AMP-forming)/AMP-acid ligase II
MLTPANRHSAQTLLDAVVLDASAEDRDAIIYVETGCPAIHVTRSAFSEAVNAYSRRLRSLGIKPNDLVVIAHTQNLESIFSFWGTIMAGAIPSMFPTLTEKLDPEIYMLGMAELVHLSDVKAVLTTDEFAPELAKEVPCDVFGSGEFKARDKDPNAAIKPPPSLPDDIVFLQHSSGTTGLQKGVALSHRSVLNQLANYGEAIALDEDDVVVSWLPLYHDMGLIAGFILPLFQGIPLVLMSPFDWVQHPALLFKAIHDHKGTLCWLPNFAYNHCARRIRQRDTEGLSVASMRMFINCSEPVYHDSHTLFLRRFREQGLREEMLSVSYAMAENTFGVTQSAPGKAPKLDIIDKKILEESKLAQPVHRDHPQMEIKVSCGPPIRETEVKVVDEMGGEQSERRVGELAIRSDCMLSGYYHRPDLEPFKSGWYLTGDIGYLAGGEVFVIGRSKDLIINAGKNIYPQDIEAIVNEVPGIRAGRAVAFGVADEREGTELIAVVAEVATEDQAERKKIAALIRRSVVARSLVTVTYVHLVGPKWLVKTSSGKLARSANREKWRSEMTKARGARGDDLN